jgi:hypothetical protein
MFAIFPDAFDAAFDEDQAYMEMMAEIYPDDSDDLDEDWEPELPPEYAESPLDGAF